MGGGANRACSEEGISSAARLDLDGLAPDRREGGNPPGSLKIGPTTAVLGFNCRRTSKGVSLRDRHNSEMKKCNDPIGHATSINRWCLASDPKLNADR